MNNCPICGLEGIPPEKSQCPQCDADLTCFKVLDSLPEETAVEQPGPSKQELSRKQLILAGVTGLLVLLAVVLSMLGLHRFGQIESRLDDQKTIIVESLADIEDKLRLFASEQQARPLGKSSAMPEAPPEGTPLKSMTGDISSPEDGTAKREAPAEQAQCPEARAVKKGETVPTSVAESELAVKEGAGVTSMPPAVAGDKAQTPGSDQAGFEFWIYRAKASDTLWDISRKYYGVGQYYPVLMEHNPEIGLFRIGSGVLVKVLKDTGPVKDIYGKIVKKEGNGLFWYYTVAEGDTLESIADKFYKTDNKVKRILDLNPGIKLRPGERIRIQLG